MIDEHDDEVVYDTTVRVVARMRGTVEVVESVACCPDCLNISLSSRGGLNMAIVEFRGGRLTASHLERKHTKASLAREYMSLLRDFGTLQDRVDELEAFIVERLGENEVP